jgi:hypothetical protein
VINGKKICKISWQYDKLPTFILADTQSDKDKIRQGILYYKTIKVKRKFEAFLIQ